jgi:hypothetical protein
MVEAFMTDPSTLHTLGLCASILSGFGAFIAAIWKLVTNHIWHMRKDIIDNSDENRVAIVRAIDTANTANVQAIQLASKDIVIAVLKDKE